MFQHPLAPVLGQRFAQGQRAKLELSGKALSGTSCFRSIQPGQNDQARRAIHEVAADRRAIAGALDEVSFSVTGHNAGGNHRGGPGNRRHVGNLAASFGSTHSRSEGLTGRPKRGQQFAP